MPSGRFCFRPDEECTQQQLCSGACSTGACSRQARSLAWAARNVQAGDPAGPNEIVPCSMSWCRPTAAATRPSCAAHCQDDCQGEQRALPARQLPQLCTPAGDARASVCLLWLPPAWANSCFKPDLNLHPIVHFTTLLPQAQLLQPGGRVIFLRECIAPHMHMPAAFPGGGACATLVVPTVHSQMIAAYHFHASTRAGPADGPYVLPCTAFLCWSLHAQLSCTSRY